MKKLAFVVLTALAVVSGSVNNGARAQLIEQGDNVINAYYGWNIYGTTLRAAYAQSGSSQDVKISGLGPLGVSFEHLMTDKIGLGLEVYYVTNGVSYDELSTDTSGNSVVYDYKVSRTKIAANVRFTFHFAGADMFDSYFFTSAGYKNTKYKFESNDPTFGDESISGIVPVDFRLGIGARYFFTENIGLNLELALGGALLSGGLTARF